MKANRFLVIFLFFIAIGCGRQSSLGPPQPDEVVLNVPGMRWAGTWPTRAKNALVSLPWVDQASIQTDISTREVRFKLANGGKLDEQALIQAFQDVNFPNTTIKKRPAQAS